mmetsp:Transcript_64816/g.180413  ORF Transcript_64816/g.180413 Transcript_64816/m.180413 type:complete len:249 (-) Transcript_64816:1270-2016(-)
MLPQLGEVLCQVLAAEAIGVQHRHRRVYRVVSTSNERSNSPLVEEVCVAGCEHALSLRRAAEPQVRLQLRRQAACPGDRRILAQERGKVRESNETIRDLSWIDCRHDADVGQQTPILVLRERAVHHVADGHQVRGERAPVHQLHVAWLLLDSSEHVLMDKEADKGVVDEKHLQFGAERHLLCLACVQELFAGVEGAEHYFLVLGELVQLRAHVCVLDSCRLVEWCPRQNLQLIQHHPHVTAARFRERL